MGKLSKNAQTIGYLLAAAGAMGHTRLIKLLYLADLESRRLRGRQLSGLVWRFHHYGPFASSIYTALKELADAGMLTESTVAYPDGKSERQIRGISAVPGDDLSTADRKILGYIAGTYGAMPLATLLEEVYQTAPMKAATRGRRIPMEMEGNRSRDEIGFDLETVIAEQEAAERGDYVTAPDYFDALRAKVTAAHAK